MSLRIVAPLLVDTPDKLKALLVPMIVVLPPVVLITPVPFLLSPVMTIAQLVLASLLAPARKQPLVRPKLLSLTPITRPILPTLILLLVPRQLTTPRLRLSTVFLVEVETVTIENNRETVRRIVNIPPTTN